MLSTVHAHIIIYVLLLVEERNFLKKLLMNTMTAGKFYDKYMKSYK